MSPLEAEIQDQCLLAATRAGAVVFRCNTGQGWVGSTQRVSQPTDVTLYPGDVLIRKARPLHAGLIKGGADLIGYHGPRFLAIETKTETGRLSPEQIIFLANVRNAGGRAFVARSPDDVTDQLA